MNKHSLLFIPFLSLSLIAGCSSPEPTPPPEEKQLVLSGTYPTEFNLNDYFSVTGMIVTCEEEIISEVTYSPFTPGNRLKEVGDFVVTVSKKGYLSAQYSIKVYNEKSLAVQSLPNKTIYDSGDTFDTTGLVIVNQREQVVTDYTLSIPNGMILRGRGDKTVTVSKDGYLSTSFIITINDSGHEDEEHSINIYYLNDTHGSYSRIDSEKEAGLGYISKYIKDHRDDYSIVLSGGDMFQGGFESNETYGQIMIDSMNEIGFDAMVLGNHEFDWGEEYIYTFKDGLDCPIISSNTFYKADHTRPSWITPYAIIDREDVRIGIIGGARENMGSSIVGSVSDNFAFDKPNEYIKSYSTELRNTMGCDIVIAAFHDEGFEGYEGSPTKYTDLTEVDPLTGYKYVDAMFFAHDHNRKNGTYNGVPYLESGCNGKNVGILTLNIKGVSGDFEIINTNTQVVNAYYNCTEFDDNFYEIDEKYEYIFEKGNEVIYTFKHSYDEAGFAEVACMSMIWYVNENKELFDNTYSTMASHNSGGVRNDVSSGEMTYREYVKVFPFDNLVSIQTCSSYNISNYNKSTYYVTYGEPTFDSEGYAKVISINYITEGQSARYYQVSYKNYDITIKEILYQYLKQNINPNL